MAQMHACVKSEVKNESSESNLEEWVKPNNDEYKKQNRQVGRTRA